MWCYHYCWPFWHGDFMPINLFNRIAYSIVLGYCPWYHVFGDLHNNQGWSELMGLCYLLRWSLFPPFCSFRFWLYVSLGECWGFIQRYLCRQTLVFSLAPRVPRVLRLFLVWGKVSKVQERVHQFLWRYGCEWPIHICVDGFTIDCKWIGSTVGMGSHEWPLWD